MPLIPTGQEFRPKCNVAIFSWNHVGSIFSDLRTTGKSLKKIEKKKGARFLRKCPFDRLVKNFGRNTMSAFLHQSMRIAYLVVQEKKGRFILKKKKILKNFLRKCRKFWQVKNFDQNAISSFLLHNQQIAHLVVLK